MEDKVQKLLRGQAELDRAKAQVSQILAIIIGELNQIAKTAKIRNLPAVVFRDETQSLEWTTWLFSGGRFFIQVDDNRNTLFRHSGSEARFLELSAVMRIRASLGYFVSQIPTKFPDVETALKPYLEAAG